MTEKTWATIIIGVVGIFLTAARRYKNSDSAAGLGVAGWTIAIEFFMWT